MAAGVTVRHAF